MHARKLLIAALLFTTALILHHRQGQSQFTIRPTAQEELILAVPDVQPSRPEQASDLAQVLKTFNDVLWADLKFSGFFTIPSKSFYPPQPIVRTEDINYDAWSVLPFQLSFMAAGTLELDGGILRAELRIVDMKQRSMSFGQRISGDSDQVRSIAHRWADEVVYKLTAGASRGIASTKIAYTSRRGAAKEIYTMDYDGYDTRPFTRNGSLNLFPSWAPDNSKLAFVSYRTGKPQLNIHSYVDGSRLPFPIFNSMTSTPVIAPDGNRLAFTMSDAKGNLDIYISRLDGTERRNITNSPAVNTSPTWAPSGNQIAFISNRGGTPQIYICDTDGANIRRIVKEGGDADSPAWSPDGRLIAFHWKPRMAENYDIFIAEVSSARIWQLTSDSGSNESPSWAPDGRHIAFQSSRSGSDQIYIMLAETNSREIRMVTSQGANTSPAWGGYVRRD
ncbi:MAG: putative tolB protein [Acidobacteria bacterium]|jgi:TolB protein|nr:putative tolB protein [Acidobacteriota bacterium]